MTILRCLLPFVDAFSVLLLKLAFLYLLIDGTTWRAVAQETQ
jgi:hypothetical protein